MFKNIKPAKEFQEQIDILKSRNIIPDDSTISFLTNVNYYRISGYIFPFLNTNSNLCDNELQFSTVASIYEFDYEMRSILQKTLEKIQELHIIFH